jgi:hypothetical protein
MGVTESRFDGKDGRIGRARCRSARVWVRVRVNMVSKLSYSREPALGCLELERRRTWHDLSSFSLLWEFIRVDDPVVRDEGFENCGAALRIG